MFKSNVHRMEKALSLGLIALVALMFAITLISPNHGWVVAPGKAALAAMEAREAEEIALVSSQP